MSVWTILSVSSAMSLPKSAGGARKRRATQIGESRLDLGIGEARINFLVKLFHYLGRSVRAVPCIRSCARS
jgi:hypothetical protein